MTHYFANFLTIVSINHQCIQAKGLNTLPVSFQIVLETSRVTLPQPIDVKDNN